MLTAVGAGGGRHRNANAEIDATVASMPQAAPAESHAQRHATTEDARPGERNELDDPLALKRNRHRDHDLQATARREPTGDLRLAWRGDPDHG